MFLGQNENIERHRQLTTIKLSLYIKFKKGKIVRVRDGDRLIFYWRGPILVFLPTDQILIYS